MPENHNPELIIQTYKNLVNEVSQLSAKFRELASERDEHKLVIDQLSKLDGSRTAYRLVGGVLVQRTADEILPSVKENYEGICKLISVVEEQIGKKDSERLQYKDKHQIMSQEEREAALRAQKNAQK